MSKELGKEIKNLRISLKMSLREFAKVSKISAPHLCDIEHGRRGVTLEFMNKCSKIFPCSIWKLFYQEKISKAAEEYFKLKDEYFKYCHPNNSIKINKYHCKGDRI